MLHKVRHTTVVLGTFYYNRRVPAQAVEGFGQRAVRCALGRDKEDAQAAAEALSVELETLWSADQVKPICLETLVRRIRPKQWDLVRCLEEYLHIRTINDKPSRLAVDALLSVAGNRSIEGYTRADARDLIGLLRMKGNKTGTIRRRVQSLHAIFEFGLLELDEGGRNPFSRLFIPLEGEDKHERQAFTRDQLSEIYSDAFARGTDTSLILPVLGETGARLAEIVGLRWEDVCFETNKLSIQPHAARRLKTKTSNRVLPMVGRAIDALKLLRTRGDASTYVFPRWQKEGAFVATHASNTLNKYLKPRFDGRTCHCFRHAMRDRLRAVEAPLDLIDQIGGWQTKLGTGVSYGEGYSVDHQRKWLTLIKLE